MASPKVSPRSIAVQSRTRRSFRPHPLQDVLINRGQLLGGGDWHDRWVGPDTVERVGTFDIEGDDQPGSSPVGGVEFRAIITFGKLVPREPVEPAPEI